MGTSSKIEHTQIREDTKHQEQTAKKRSGNEDEKKKSTRSQEERSPGRKETGTH